MATSVQATDIRALLFRQWRSARSSDFAGKVLGTYLSRILVILVGLVMSVLVARILGPTGRGLYAVAVATGALGVQFGNLGLHTSNAYLVARKPHYLPFLTGNTLLVSFGVGAFIAAVLVCVLVHWPSLLSIRGAVLVVAVLGIPFGLAYNLLQNLMLGVQDTRGYNIAEIANRVVPLMLIGLLVLAHAVTISSVLSATLLVVVVSGVWIIGRLKRRVGGEIRCSSAVFLDGISYAIKAYLAATFCFLVLRADLFMVQHMLGPEQAGYYSIASTMADYVATLATVIGMILFPKLSAITDIRRKLAITRKAAIGTALAMVPLLAFASVLATPAVRLLFGPAFLPASLAFMLLMPGMLFLGIHSVVVQFLNSIGYPKSVVIIWGTCSVFNVAVNIWAIPHYGIAGASVVSSVSYFLAFFFVIWVVHRSAQSLLHPVAMTSEPI
jgi:O-antigen/teichoic acid export membrane protein